MKSGQPLVWYFNPYVQLAASAVLITAAEVLLKQGAITTTAEAGEFDIFGLRALASPTTWLGIILFIVAFLSWLHVLRLMPLTQAYALISVVHVLVPLAAWLFLAEAVSATRAAGIALVLVGTILVAAPAAHAEEDL
jgi:drug/metabolite transporter (DMT)-like permease